MKTLNKFIVSIALLCLSQTAFAACNDADAYDDCIEITGDENDSIGSGTGGGGSLGFGGSGGGGSDGGSDGGNGSGGGSGQGGGESSGGEEETEEEPVDPPKTPRQICHEEAAVAYYSCRVLIRSVYNIDYALECSHLASGSVVIGGFLTLGRDLRAECDKRLINIREDGFEMCSLKKAIDINKCP